MRWRLRTDIPKREHGVIFVNNLRRDFTRDDFFKESLAHGTEIVPRSIHNQRTCFRFRLGNETFAEGGDDLILHLFATGAPALGAGELLGTATQAAKMNDARRLLQFGPQFIAEALKEKEF